MTGVTIGCRLQLVGGPGEGFSLGRNSFWSHSITLSSDWTMFPGSTLRFADGSSGLENSGPLVRLISRVRELQDENAILEARLAKFTGGVDSTASDDDVTVNMVDQVDQAVQYHWEMEHLALDVVRLHQVLNNIKTNALRLKARYDAERGIGVQLQASIAAMKKEIEMATRIRLKLEAKRASLRTVLCLLTEIQDEEMQRANLRLLRSVLPTETEITACKKELQALHIHLHNLIDTNKRLKRSLSEGQFKANTVVSGYQAQIAGLEATIEAAKQVLDEQIITHKELLDLMKALGAEIGTYWSLLDVEELSSNLQSF